MSSHPIECARKQLQRLIALAGLASLASLASLTDSPLQSAHAETVYRCDNRYSDLPCHGGEVIVVEDHRSPAQQSESRRYTQRDATLADALEAERMAFEQPSSAPEATAQKARKPIGAKAAKRAAAANAPSPHRRPPSAAKPPADFKAIAPTDRPSYASEAEESDSD